MSINPSRRRFTQGACALGLMSWLVSCGGEDVPAVELKYASAVQGMISTYFMPGVLAAVRRPGQRQWSGAFGKANLESGTGLLLGSTFPIRSVTKSFTVTIVLQLQREGLLSLDDKIDRYVRGMPNGHLITLADLAGMQSRLVDYSATTAFLDLFIPDLQRVWTEEELVGFSAARSRWSSSPPSNTSTATRTPSCWAWWSKPSPARHWPSSWPCASFSRWG